jgi:hypothetical protein
VEAADVNIEAGAQINGDLIYTSAGKADIDPAATVIGRIVRRVPAQSSRFDKPDNVALNLLRSIAGALILGLVLLWLLPGLLPSASGALRSSPLASLLVGIVAVIVIPVVAIVLLVVTGVIGAGFSVPLVLMVASMLLLLLSKVIVAFTIGALFLRVGRGNRRTGGGRLFFALLIGVVVLALLSLIPVVGGWINLLVALLAMGAALLAFFRWRKGPESEPDVAGRPAAPAPVPQPALTTTTAEG